MAAPRTPTMNVDRADRARNGFLVTTLPDEAIQKADPRLSVVISKAHRLKDTLPLLLGDAEKLCPGSRSVGEAVEAARGGRYADAAGLFHQAWVQHSDIGRRNGFELLMKLSEGCRILAEGGE